MLSRFVTQRIAERGAALLDVMTAGAILSLAILMYAATAPISTQDTDALQQVWRHRQVSDAAYSFARSHYVDLASELAQRTDVVRISEVELTPHLSASLKSPESALRPNLRGNSSCVLVRQLFNTNQYGQAVPSGQLEVLHAEVGGSAMTDVERNVALSGGVVGAVTLVNGVLTASSQNPNWTIADLSATYLSSQAAQTCTANADLWRNRLASRRLMDATSYESSQATSGEYLSQSANEASTWLRTMDTQLVLGPREYGEGKATVANLYALGGLSLAVPASACALTDVGLYRGSSTTNAAPVSELLQCQNTGAGTYQWQAVSGVLAAKNINTQRVVLGTVRDENSPCIQTLLGTLSRTDGGAPLACMGSEASPNDKRWVRVGVPWAWVNKPQTLYPLTLASAIPSSGLEISLSNLNIPTVARMIQIYVEVQLPTGGTSPRTYGVQIQKTEMGAAGNWIELFSVTDHSSLTVYQGRPILLDRGSNPTVYKLRMDQAIPPNASVMVNLLGYSY